MLYIVDIDNTICQTTDDDYINAKPFFDRIKTINNLYNNGHTIIYWTGRGSKSGKDWEQLTINQLNDWGCLRHQLLMKKIQYDYWIDDKCINSEIFFYDK